MTLRGVTSTARAGETINVPANAPHRFTNSNEQAARLLCVCTPAGQDEFFTRVGDPVAARTSPPPNLSEAELDERRRRMIELAPHYRTEILV